MNRIWLTTLLSVALCAQSVLAATFTVTSTANSGGGTLRQAILNANATAEQDTIVFNITGGGGGVKTIIPTNALPPITNSVIIDGTTQPGFTNLSRFIEINGTNAGAAYGLELRAGSNVIKGLAINRFFFAGIAILTNGNNRIESCYIGTDATGTLRRGNGLITVTDGVLIIDSSNNIIGGTNPTARNVLSANGRYGVGVVGTLSRSNRIEGNFIGTDASGLAFLGNRDGVGIVDSPFNVIGGAALEAGNVISGNFRTGVEMYGLGALGNSLMANLIGVNALGEAPLGNGLYGVLISSGIDTEITGAAAANRIGTKARGNIISGNGLDGIQLAYGSFSNHITGNAIGASLSGLALIGNGRHGVAMFDSSNNVVAIDAKPNYIVGNRSNGVFLANSVANRIAVNAIATNGLDGIQLVGGANDNKILGNIIGAGNGFNDTTLLGNGRHGVAIFDSVNNQVSVADNGFGNFISGNRSNGVFMGRGSLGTGSISNYVQGNQIGTTEVIDIGNGAAGVFVQGNGNMIGGFEEAEANWIAYNGTHLMARGHGVVIESGTNNAILGNQILGNAGRGIDLGNDSFTVNDMVDLDEGANDKQNYPVVTRVRFDRGADEITWLLHSRPDRSYYIEFFANSEDEPSGFGEGERKIGSRFVVTDPRGVAEFTTVFPSSDDRISATATDAIDRNTSEFSPVDTDGDAIADGWEFFGIDYNEDGVTDLVLTNAHPWHKNIYVEIDSMIGRTPNEENLSRVSLGYNLEGGFLNAPGNLVQNRDGGEGIYISLELDENYLPLASWGQGDFSFFDVLKANFYGTVAQRGNTNTIAAKKLVYRYCIFADTVPDASGMARVGGSDLFIALGTLSSHPEDPHVPAAVMHELGHSLGLHHGGADIINLKPNYHSIMNYAWSYPGSRNQPWIMDFSREEFGVLEESDLEENTGLGAPTTHAGHMVMVGPYLMGPVPIKPKLVPEVGPVDWDDDGTLDDSEVQRDLNFLSGGSATPADVLRPSEDWSRLRFYFLDHGHSLPNSEVITNDLSPTIMADFAKLGTDVGLLEFSQLSYKVSETGGVAVISVTRVFEVEGTVSISFSAFSGGATEGVDFIPTNGVLTFVGGEINKTFGIIILNNGSAEKEETVHLLLSNPTGGATLGARTQAMVTIVDDDPPGHYAVGNTNNSGPGSLRQALLDANAASGVAIIDFNIPGTSGLTISPSTALPEITNIVTIDATTQPGYSGVPIIELNGASAGNTDGLRINGGRCIVRGLIINRFGFSGISLNNLGTGVGQNRVEGCYIGLNRQGTLDQGNGSHGINVLSSSNVIGGLTVASRNYISGNNGVGVAIIGAGGTHNQVLGNVIGLGVDGSDQGNSASGVDIGSSHNFLGGIQTGARNVISGNNQDGVSIGGVENRILGNFIGTDLAGMVARGNSSNGIIAGTTRHVIGGDKAGAGNLISGNGRRGIVLGATATIVHGNKIGTDISGQNSISNLQGGIILTSSAISNQIGGTTLLAGNTIAFNNGIGVFVSSAFASNNIIRGNSIYSHPSSFLGIDLFEAGVTLNDTNDTDVGANHLQNHPVLLFASNSLAGTVVTGKLNSRPNSNYTIDFYASFAPDPSGWGEGESWIGSTNVTTDGSGNATFVAKTGGVYLKGKFITATTTDFMGNTSEFSPPALALSSIPGRTFTVLNVNDSGEGSLRQAILDANAYPSERDTIKFNIAGFGVRTIKPLSALPDIGDPVVIDGYTQPGSTPNTAANGHNGVLLIELDGSLAGNVSGLTFVGGNSVVRGLIINRFGQTPISENFGGIDLSGVGGNRIEGNFIGTDTTGMLDRGNLFAGVVIQNSSNNVVGGILPQQRNIISGTDHFVSGSSLRAGNGVTLLNTSGDRIEGNLIGTAADGVTPLGNASFGIAIGGANHIIGGTNPAAGNIIAFNGTLTPTTGFAFYGGGISEPSGHSDARNAILGNSIYSNVSMGIEGDRVNGFVTGHFPFLSSAMISNGTLIVQGWLSTVGREGTVTNTTHRIEIFGNDSFDSTGYGEGQRFLGWTPATTDSNGFATFTAVLPAAVSNGQFLTATSTDDRNNTSEFSPRLNVGDVLTNFVVNSSNDLDDGVASAAHTSLREAILAANNRPGPDTISFAIGSGARTISLTNILPAIMDAATTLDASTQPGFLGQPLIYLDGRDVTPAGLRLYSVSNTVRGFAISRFGSGIYSDGIYGYPVGRNVIEGNYIGTDLTGKTNVATLKQEVGIYLNFRSMSNRIGGTSLAARNVISGNTRAGILSFFSEGNLIQGNLIGTDVTGTNALRNGGGGVSLPLGGVILQQSEGSVVGGPEPGARNVIAANVPAQLTSDRAMLVENNYIAVDVTGTRELTSSGQGHGFSATSSVIRSNLTPSLTLTSSNLVEGNLIGTDVSGMQPLVSGFAGFDVGIRINGIGNLVGGSNASARNVIGNWQDGIVINGASNTVQGNFVGVRADGFTPLGNSRDGIVLQASGNLIGGLQPGSRNIIAFNTNRGIAVISGTNNAFLGNSIFSNTGLGIDLGTNGVTANDLGDIDVGANLSQNFPLLSAVRNVGSATLFDGTLQSRPMSSYRIEFFSNTNCHASGNGQGRTFLAATVVATDVAGNAPFSFNHPVPLPAGLLLTATATDPNNNTSEFSPCIAVINDTNYVFLSFTTTSPHALSWPVAAPNFLLEHATNLAPPVIWQVISNGIVTNAGNRVFAITNDPASPTLFFRLRRP